MSRQDDFPKVDGEAIGLLMTYRCNLNCKYCYIAKKRSKDMSLEMAQSILEPFLKKDEGLLNITFVGGETLMAIEVIRPLVEWVQNGIWKRPYLFLGATNGTLLNDDLKQWLWHHRNCFILGLSYDGLPSTQINNRGNDNIDVDFFIETWPTQPIQMTINEDSVSQMAKGVIYLLEKGAVVHPNVAYEEKEWDEKSVYEYARQLNRLIYYYNCHTNYPVITQFIHDLNLYADCIDNPAPQVRACGAGDGYQVFDTDGHSYPCHILSPLVLEGRNLDKIKKNLIAATNDFSDTKCSTCPYTSSCPTCMACNFIYRDHLQNRDATHCQLMKIEVKAFIKKEVLRLKAKQHLTSDDATEIDSIRKILNFEKSGVGPHLDLG